MYIQLVEERLNLLVKNLEFEEFKRLVSSLNHLRTF